MPCLHGATPLCSQGALNPLKCYPVLRELRHIDHRRNEAKLILGRLFSPRPNTGLQLQATMCIYKYIYLNIYIYMQCKAAWKYNSTSALRFGKHGDPWDNKTATHQLVAFHLASAERWEGNMNGKLNNSFLTACAIATA